MLKSYIDAESSLLTQQGMYAHNGLAKKKIYLL
jgi:hypothetical protein